MNPLSSLKITSLKEIVLIFAYCAIIAATFGFLRNSIKDKVDQLTDGITEIKDAPLLISFPEDESLMSRFKEQYCTVQARAILHLDLSKYIFRNYYIAVTIASLTGVIAILTLFYITNKGWAQANKYLVLTFLLMSGSLPFLAFFLLCLNKKSILKKTKSFS